MGVTAMDYNLAKLSEDQRQAIDELELKLGVVLVAYEGYQTENQDRISLDHQ